MQGKWQRKLAQTHLEHLAAQHDIDIIWMRGQSWKYAEAFRQSRSVKIPVPWNPRLYLIALHEFGHLLSPLARRLWSTTSAEGTTACEGAAWGWAFDHVHPALATRIDRLALCQAEYGIVFHAQQLVRETRERAR